MSTMDSEADMTRLCMCWWQSSWQAEAILREAASPMMCKAGLERVTSKGCQDFSLKNSLFEEMPTVTYGFSEITSKDPSRIKFDHGVPFFFGSLLFTSQMWTMASTVVWVTSARLVHSMPLLPLCHKLHHPCRLGTNPWMSAGPMQVERGHLENPHPTMMSHVYNWLRWCFYCSQFRFRNLLRLFTWDLNFFSKGAEAHSNASGNWSCADVYSAARTNSSVTWPCKHSHSNCIQLAYMKT